MFPLALTEGNLHRSNTSSLLPIYLISSLSSLANPAISFRSWKTSWSAVHLTTLPWLVPPSHLLSWSFPSALSPSWLMRPFAPLPAKCPRRPKPPSIPAAPLPTIRHAAGSARTSTPACRHSRPRSPKSWRSSILGSPLSSPLTFRCAI